MALFPTPQESCFYLDPAAGLTDGNLWVDSSPHGLHVTPVGYAGPSFGIFTGPSGAKAINFNGANQRGDLPLRFYQIGNLPSTEITVAVVATWNSAQNIDRVFDCRNAASTHGFYLAITTTERMITTVYDGAVSSVSIYDQGSIPLSARTVASVYSRSVTAVGGGIWHDRVGRLAASALTIAGIGYDPTVVPTIGALVGGGFYVGMDLYCLGIWPRVWTHAEAVAFCDYWMDRC